MSQLVRCLRPSDRGPAKRQKRNFLTGKINGGFPAGSVHLLLDTPAQCSDISILDTINYKRFVALVTHITDSADYGKELRAGRLIFPIQVVERLRQTKGLTLGGTQVWRAR